ncbi:MAG: efflux RND transporter periplasmic adaptor subunit [Arachidicoccus sp.]|nr:efflux RND transporter periplasmic adaptor subunit [Arachidicoccus sp.]
MQLKHILNFYKAANILKLSTLSLILFTLLSCGSKNPQGAQGAMPPPALPVITLSNMDANTYQDFTASVEGSKDIEIRPQVSGILTNIYVDEGAYVHKGQILFRIDSRPYSEQQNSAHANLLAAQAALENAKINVDKLLPLVSNNVVSDVQLKSAQAAYDQAKANVAQAKAAESSASINVGYTTIEAPANGYIGRIPYKTGSLVGSTSPDALTVLSQTKDVYVYFSMGETDFLHFADKYPGATISDKVKQIPPVELVLADDSIYPQKGKIEIVEGQFDKSVGAISFRATFPNDHGLLRSGNTGKIRIPNAYQNALVVPQEATFELQDKVFVYTIADSNKVVTKPITIADRTVNYYLVSDGVKAGDKIILSSQSTLLTGGLKDGMAIQPQMVSTDSLLKEKPLQ